MRNICEKIRKEIKKIEQREEVDAAILDKYIKYRECAAIPCAYLGNREDFDRFLDPKPNNREYATILCVYPCADTEL